MLFAGSPARAALQEALRAFPRRFVINHKEADMFTRSQPRCDISGALPAWSRGEAEMIRLNCARRDLAHEALLPVRRSGRFCMEPCAPCLAHAVEADAGGCVPMPAEDGHCRCHAAAFRASEAFPGMLSEACEARDARPAAPPQGARQTDRPQSPVRAVLLCARGMPCRGTRAEVVPRLSFLMAFAALRC